MAHLWRNLEDKKKEISFTNCSTDDLTFLKELKNFEVPEALLLSLEQKQGSPLEILGKGTLTAIGKFHRIIAFLGEVILALGSCIRHPSSFRVKSFIKYLDQTGVPYPSLDLLPSLSVLFLFIKVSANWSVLGLRFSPLTYWPFPYCENWASY